MKKAVFMRTNKTIVTIGTDERQTFQSINAAKRESRKIQMSSDGGLGRGTVTL